MINNTDMMKEIQYERSFASHEKSKYWSDKNKLKPRQVFKSSNKKCIFNCDKCNHEFESRLNNITKGQWCSFCANQKLCDNNCIFCFERSFASYEKSKYWSDKNKLKLRQVFKSSKIKCIFNCDKCNHEFESRLNDITNGSWCSYCVNKTETKLYEQLLPFYNIKRQYKVEWCKNKTFLPFDFVLEESKIIIELDGAQHFTQVSNWSSPEENQKNDKYKEKCANDNGYSIVRILQEDVFYDTYDWLYELKNNIDKIKNENTMQNIYMCKNDEYGAF
jgi:very-short-patch-repair endonuclease